MLYNLKTETAIYTCGVCGEEFEEMPSRVDTVITNKTAYIESLATPKIAYADKFCANAHGTDVLKLED